MGFLSREKLVILILLLQLVIFAVGFLDGILRKNVSLYEQNVPHFWWFTEVWAEMNTNRQNFSDSLPKLTRIIWTPIIVYATVVVAKGVGLSS
jgi:hypothetical protein